MTTGLSRDCCWEDAVNEYSFLGCICQVVIFRGLMSIYPREHLCNRLPRCSQHLAHKKKISTCFMLRVLTSDRSGWLDKNNAEINNPYDLVGCLLQKGFAMSGEWENECKVAVLHQTRRLLVIMT